MRLYQPVYTRAGVAHKSATWRCCFTVHGRVFDETTGLRDKNAAQAHAAARLREEELRAAGIETHGQTRRADLACLFDEYRASMTRRGLAPKHVSTTLARCAALVQGLDSVADLTPTAVRLGLERLRGASAKTVNAYRTALHGFCAWLVREGRWASNPVESVQRSRVVSDGPARRALTPDEQRRLLKVAGRDTGRWLCYYIALNTGLRRAELTALTGDSIRLLPPEDPMTVGGRYAVRVRGGTAKNRREDLLPLPLGLSIRVPLFPNAHPLDVPSMAAFRRDLKQAGIPEDGPEGRVDFHSLRVTFATNLARAGVPLTLAQRLMRHSDPSLTSNIYTRLRIDDEQNAVDRANPDHLIPDPSIPDHCCAGAFPAGPILPLACVGSPSVSGGYSLPLRGTGA